MNPSQLDPAAPPRALILDFDGTFTDVEAEGAPFMDAYRHDVADLLGVEIDDAWEQEARRIRERPEDFGWLYKGRVVAPGNADPYVRSTCIAQNLFAAHKVLRDPQTRDAVLQAFYRKCYPLTCTVFRPDAREVLELILRLGLPTYVVTNSDTEAVRRKIDQLGLSEPDRLKIFGGAQKFVLEEPQAPHPAFQALPVERSAPGLSTRAVALRRGRYFDALLRICGEVQCQPAELLVCGDIYDLDLALPAELGAAVHLVTREATAPYEVAAARGHGRGGSSVDLQGLLQRIQ